MANLVPQGYPDEMDVMVVTEIRESRDYKDQRENLVSRILVDKKKRMGQVDSLGLPV